MFSYKSKIQDLKGKANSLKKKREEVQLMVDAAERNEEVIKPDVLEWLRNVDETTKEVDEFLDAATSDKISCFYGSCPNPRSRSLMIKRASNISGEVTKLQETSTFDKVADPAPPVQLLPSVPVDFRGFGSRMLTKRNVLDVLMDNKTSTVGIYGVPGVGKTTMIEEIAEKVKVESLFDEVVMATLAQFPDIKYIQDQMASKLGLMISEKVDINLRAKQLEARFRAGMPLKRTLVILDELWQNLDFQTVGIPVGKDFTGLKVMFVSSDQEICNKMNAQKMFEVKALTKKEGCYLFKKTAGIPEDANDDLRQMAEAIANECRGLPLAIIAIAKALRNKPKKAWKDALTGWAKTSPSAGAGQHNLAYSRIELSYHCIEDDEAKSLLQLCCLFPEDYYIPVEHLVRCGKGLQMFKGTRTLSEVRDRIDSIVDYLKECHLLLASAIYKCVKLHNVVRDVCLSVASKEEQGVRVTNISRMEQLQQDDMFKTSTAISMRIQEIVQLPSILHCPELKLLWLHHQSGTFSIPGDFFSELKDLRVLNINKMENGLPSSLHLLTSLQTLCLDFCKLSTGLALIGNLKKLEILSFYLADVHEIPTEIADLRNLKLLDFRFKEDPYPMPSRTLLGLKKLEELYLGDYFQHEERVSELDLQQVTKISSMSLLRTLQISISEADLLLQVLRELHLEKLERFHITRRTGRSKKNYNFSRCLELLDADKTLLLDPVIVMLLKRTTHLILESKGLKTLVSELGGDVFWNLNKLELQSGDYEYLIDAAGGVPTEAFANLESLDLDGVKHLKEICKGNLPAESFRSLKEVKLNGLDSMTHLWRGVIEPPSLCNIRVLKMKSCQAIRSLFSELILKCLGQLQDLDLADCGKLEEVVSKEEDNKEGKMVQHPKLKVVKLDSLSNIKSFCSQSDVDTSLHAFFNQVSLPRLEVVHVNEISGSRFMIGGQMEANSLRRVRIMKIENCRNLEKFATSDSIKLLDNLEQLELVYCQALQVVFDFEGLNFSREEAKEVLRHLEKLRLSRTKTTHMWRNVPKGINKAFQNLKYLEVSHCLELDHFLSPSIANMLVSLEYLELRMTGMKEVIGDEEEVSLRDETASANKIVFPKLSSIILRAQLWLEMFSSGYYEVVLPSLTELHINGCPELKKFSAGKLKAPMLKKILTGPNQSVPTDLEDREDLAVLHLSEDECQIL